MMAENLEATSLCAPFPAYVDERLRQSSIRHIVGFNLLYGDLSYPLEYQSNCSLTFDENWAPYAQFQGNFRMPDKTTAGFLDPRLDPLIEIIGGYEMEAGDKQAYPLARLHLRSVVWNAPAMNLDITAASSETDLQDFVWYLQTPAPVPTGTVKDALDWCLDTAGNKEPLEYTETGPTVTLPDQGVQQGQNIWDLARDFAAGGQMWFYHDGLGTWHMTPRPVPESTPKTILQTGRQGTVISYQIGQSREDYADGVIVTHEWGSQQKIVGKASVSSPTRWTVVPRRTAATQDQADKEAETLLSRFQDLRRSFEITAKSAYWLRPGDYVTLRIPGVNTACRVSRVQYSFPSGRMQVRLIDPAREVTQ